MAVGLVFWGSKWSSLRLEFRCSLDGVIPCSSPNTIGKTHFPTMFEQKCLRNWGPSNNQRIFQSVACLNIPRWIQMVRKSLVLRSSSQFSQLVNQTVRELDAWTISLCFCFVIPDSQQPIFPLRFLFLKLPPPPRAVLLVLGRGRTKYYK